MKQLINPVVFSLLFASAINAEAIIISLNPSSQNILEGDQISLDVFYDTEGVGTTGGSFSVTFNNIAFEFLSVEFDSTLPDDPLFRVSPTTPVSSNVFNLGFGSFADINGSGRAATLLFQSSQEGIFDFTLDTPIAPLVNNDSFPNPTYVDAQVQIAATPTPAAVPIPAAVWLLMSGISGLSLLTRRKPST